MARELEVIGPNGQTGTVPEGTDLSGYPGWNFVPAAAESSRGNVPSNAAKSQPNYNRTIGPEAARMATNALPGILAIPGFGIGEALGGPPGAMLGSYLGGKAGEWARYGLAPSVGLAQQVPQVGGMSDVLNLLAGGTGLGMKAGVQPLAETVGQWAYRPATSAQRSFKGLAAEVGGPPSRALIRTGLKRGATVGRVFGTGGSEAANAAREAASEAAAIKIEAADKAGLKITAADLAEPSLRRARQAAKGALSPAERSQQIAEVRARANEILNEGTVIRRMRNVFTPSEVDRIRRATQENLRPQMNQAAAGNFKSQGLENDLMVGADKAIKTRIPGLRGARSNERAAIGTARMVENAEMRGRPQALPIGAGLAVGMHNPAEGIASYLATHAALSPEIQSRLAVGLFNAPPWALQYSPLTLAALARMGMTPPDTSGAVPRKE